MNFLFNSGMYRFEYTKGRISLFFEVNDGGRATEFNASRLGNQK